MQVFRDSWKDMEKRETKTLFLLGLTTAKALHLHMLWTSDGMVTLYVS